MGSKSSKDTNPGPSSDIKDSNGHFNDDKFNSIRLMNDEYDWGYSIINLSKQGWRSFYGVFAMEEKTTQSLNHLTETEIQFIVNNIGNDWIQLATKLGLCLTDVTGIKQGPGNLRDKVYQVIDKWKQNNGDEATKDHMIQCLTEIERRDIADDLSYLPPPTSTKGNLAEFKQQLVEMYSHLSVPQPPRIDKDIPIDSIFIDQHLQVCTLEFPEEQEILHLQSIIHTIAKHKMLRTLVEGYPGFGKTTLASKIATDWAKGRKYISSVFDLVLLIPLREVGNQHLLHFIVDMVNRAIQCTTFTVEKLGKYFDQHKILLLLDGYDEMSPESQKQIHPILKKNILNNTYILVTSRRGFFTIKQYATNSSKSLTFKHENLLYNFWDARVILMGITKEQRTKVLQEHFEIPADTLDETNELFGDKADELFKCPLLVFWLGWMLETYGLQDIPTRTAFYKRLVNLILHKTLVRENKLQEKDAFDIFLTSTDELTISVQQQIIKFGELAKQKMIEYDVLFNECDLKSVEKSILLKSDLLISYKSLTNQQEQTVYQPMHRSLLEFLVAFHVRYSNNDIKKFKQSISMLMKKGWQPSQHSLLYPFIGGFLEDKAHWLFESLSPWSHKYSAFGSELMNIFQELRGAEGDDLLQHILIFVPDYCNILALKNELSSSLFQRLLKLVLKKQLVKFGEWRITNPFPVSKITLEKLYVTSGYRNRRLFVLDNVSVHCKKLIYSISTLNEKMYSLKDLLVVCRNITANEIELHLKELEDCDSLFDELQKEMNNIKLHRVNCYRCQLKDKHVNVLTQLVKRGCITKGITIKCNYGEIKFDNLSELWKSVVKSSITEFALEEMNQILSFDISKFVQLQLLHLQLDTFSIDVTSIQHSTLLNVDNIRLILGLMMIIALYAQFGVFGLIGVFGVLINYFYNYYYYYYVRNDNNNYKGYYYYLMNVINALDRFKHINCFRCDEWLLRICISKKVRFLTTVTELHVVVREDSSRCPSFIQFMPSLTTFTLDVSDMRENFTSLEEWVISALESTTTTTTTNSSGSKSKQVKLLAIHFIPSVQVFQFFVNCLTKVKSMNLECLEMSMDYDTYFRDPGFSNTLHELNDLLRKDNITRLNLIDLSSRNGLSAMPTLIELAGYRPGNGMKDVVRSCFSEEQIEMKQRFYHKNQQLRLYFPAIHCDRQSNLFYFELKKKQIL